jgi:hypothetical protein
MTLNLVAVPVLAALAAGTGAVATFVNGSAATPPATVAAQTDQPCATQTWPYIDSKCMTSGQAKPKVRMVMAPRSNESDEVSRNANTGPAGAVPTPAMPATVVPEAPAPQGAPMLTSRDTVLRQPDVMTPPKVSKPREKRSDRRRERRIVAQSYQVPAESDRRSRAVLVVRPLRLDFFR